eukprot:s495_g5.t1
MLACSASYRTTSFKDVLKDTSCTGRGSKPAGETMGTVVTARSTDASLYRLSWRTYNSPWAALHPKRAEEQTALR